MDCVVPKDPWYQNLINTIVFSSKGDRPDMEKLAGADLDGDTYWVCWQAEFLKHFKPSEPAPSKAKNVKVYEDNKEEVQVEMEWEKQSHMDQSI